MSLPQGIDFRLTSGFVTDPANCDAELGGAATPNYPRTTAQGNTVGWEDINNGTRDRDSLVDARLAGIAFATEPSRPRYRIDLPSAGDYKFRVAAGDAGNGNDARIELLDGVTSLGDLVTKHVGVGGGQYYDATDTLRVSNGDWVVNNALSTAKTFAGTICRFKLGDDVSGLNYVLAHLWVESAGGAPAASTDVLMGQAWL